MAEQDIPLHVRYQFSDSVQQLAGHPDRSVLPELIQHKSASGLFTTFDTAEADDNAITTAAATMRAAIHTPSSATGASPIAARQNPEMDIKRARTISTPNYIEWFHTFDEVDQLIEAADNKSPVMLACRRKMFKSRSVLFVSRLDASVARLSATSALTTSPAPTTVTFDTTAGTGNEIVVDDGILDLDTILQIKERFETRYVDNEKIFCVISPKTKRKLLQAEGLKLTSRDFVSSYDVFAKAVLPDIYGLYFVVHPACSDTKAYAFTADGACWFNYDGGGLKTEMGIVPQERFAIKVRVSEKVDMQRVDDKKVIRVTLTNG